MIEPEFSVVMARARREGNALPPALRDGWDGRPAMQAASVACPAPRSATYFARNLRADVLDELLGQLVQRQLR